MGLERLEPDYPTDDDIVVIPRRGATHMRDDDIHDELDETVESLQTCRAARDRARKDRDDALAKLQISEAARLDADKAYGERLLRAIQERDQARSDLAAARETIAKLSKATGRD